MKLIKYLCQDQQCLAKTGQIFVSFLFSTIQINEFVSRTVIGLHIGVGFHTTLLILEGPHNFEPHLFAIAQDHPPMLVSNQKAACFQDFFYQGPSNLELAILVARVVIVECAFDPSTKLAVTHSIDYVMHSRTFNDIVKLEMAALGCLLLLFAHASHLHEAIVILRLDISRICDWQQID